MATAVHFASLATEVWQGR